MNTLYKIISVEDALKLDNPLFVDMRSPSEYATGHVPGAINIPLFTDDERAIVGTIYKTVGVEEAKQSGLSIVSTKLPEIVSEVKEYYKNGNAVIIYCWRGGMRSKSVVTVLGLMGIKAFQLLGGYKSYRNYVLESLHNFRFSSEIIVLCGSTGVGKTNLLKMLDERGVPVIDLEKLANHRGSVFGQIGLGKPETAQNFEANLLNELKRLNKEPFIVLECESRRIGNIYLPEVLYKSMQIGRKILVCAGIENRISRLIEEYTDLYGNNQASIIAGITSLKKRLGKKKTEEILSNFTNGEIREVVYHLLVDYYDPLYGYENSDPAQYDLIVNADNLEQAARSLISYLEELGGNYDADCRRNTAQ